MIILFDLDGTLINTGEGITRSVRYALEKMGIEENDQRKLQRFIGPPLLDSFQREYGFTEEQAKQAITFYRERYQDIGLWESELYPDVENTLQILKEQGHTLAVASSKPEQFCKKLLEHFKIADYFTMIGGATMDGKVNTKIEVLEYVLAALKIKDRKNVVLVGDTKYDAEGARKAGISCIGITYGFEQDLAAMEAEGTVAVLDTLPQVAKRIENF